MPSFWKVTGITAGQTTGVPISVIGITRDSIPMARHASVVSVGCLLSEAITNGLIRIEATRNGIDTGRTFDLTGSSGTKAIWELTPGGNVLTKGQELGFKWGSSGTLTPSGTIELTIFVEIQWET